MTDEHFMRQWNKGHAAFSADVDRKLAILARHLSSRERRYFGIGEVYGHEDAGRSPAKSLLSGLAACVATTALFLTVAALAVPGPAFAAQGAIAEAVAPTFTVLA